MFKYFVVLQLAYIAITIIEIADGKPKHRKNRHRIVLENYKVNTGSEEVSLCKKSKDACSLNPCLNGGKCTLGVNREPVCKCDFGFTGTFCGDFDECLSTPCDVTAVCTNTAGSYTCACNIGYHGDGKTCTDSDECLTTPCDVNAVCTNTAGSFTCACNIGYHGDGKTCTDVDECFSSPCDVNAVCTNTTGSYTCACNIGFTGDGKTCYDFDECLSTPCDVIAVCTNTAGSYTCACNIGYHWDGKTCTDVDECLSLPCDVNAVCTNTAGSYTCACNIGYTGDGKTCYDSDECLSSPCDVNGVCRNTRGSYTCACKSGYFGDGKTCYDSDECLSTPCDVNGVCTNTAGSFTCACNFGYYGDGKICTVCPPSFEQLGDGCYSINDRDRNSYLFSQYGCTQLTQGAFLVEPNTRAELDAILMKVENIYLTTNIIRAYWIGINDLITEGNVVYDSSSAAFTIVNLSAYNTGLNDCGALFKNASGTNYVLIMRACTGLLFSICEVITSP